MAHFHQRRRTRIRIPNPIVTLYYAQLFPLVWIQIWIPVRRVSLLVTVPILGTDLRPRDLNPNPFPLVEMSHKGPFPPTEMDSDSDSKTYRYIVLCTTFSTGTDSDLDPCTESFPIGYCTHFRDRSPSQGSESESVSIGGNEP